VNESNRNDNLIPEVELRDNLVEKYREVSARMEDILATAATWTEVADEEDARMVSDVRKGFQALIKEVDGLRLADKAPWMGLAKVVDGFFMPRLDKLSAELRRINGLALNYANKKEAAARAELERERAEKRRLAEEALMKVREEEERAKAAFANPNTPPDAQLGPTPYDESVTAAVAAVEAAQKADKAALAKPAELARVRGDLGSVTSPKRRWTGEVTDRQTLDLEALRLHFSLEDLNKAVRAWVRANTGDDLAPPLLRGAKVQQEKYL
jgi:hypothetical protein